MKTFVLNLERHTERRVAIEQQLQDREIDFEILQGVDGKQLSAEAIAAVYSATETQRFIGRQLTLGEIGCAMSHCLALSRVVSDNLPAALILEDDALIGPMVKQITNSLNELATKNDFDVCLLTYVTKYSDWGSRKIPESEHQLVKVFDAYLGYGYIVTNYGARRLLNHLSTLYHPFDYWNTFRRQGVVSVKAIIPYVVGESDLGSDSEIDDERRRISADLAFGRTVALQRFVRRFFYEKFIYQIVKPVMRIRRQPKGTLERECQASIPTDPR